MIVETRERERERELKCELKAGLWSMTSDDPYCLSPTFSNVYFGTCNNSKEHCDLNIKK